MLGVRGPGPGPTGQAIASPLQCIVGTVSRWPLVLLRCVPPKVIQCQSSPGAKMASSQCEPPLRAGANEADADTETCRSLPLPPWFPQQLGAAAVPTAGEMNKDHILRVAGTVLAKRICSKHIAFVTILGNTRVACDGDDAVLASSAHDSGDGHGGGGGSGEDGGEGTRGYGDTSDRGLEPAAAVQVVLRSTEFGGQTRPLAKSLRVGAVVNARGLLYVSNTGTLSVILTKLLYVHLRSLARSHVCLPGLTRFNTEVRGNPALDHTAPVLGPSPFLCGAPRPLGRLLLVSCCAARSYTCAPVPATCRQVNQPGVPKRGLCDVGAPAARLDRKRTASGARASEDARTVRACYMYSWLRAKTA